MKSGYQALDELKDGTPVVVRSICPADREAIARAFSALVPEALYRRFFTSKKGLTDADLRELTDVDPEHVVALVLSAAGKPELLGGGRYCATDTLGEARAAELAFTTAEGQRGRGIASALLRHLAGIARSQGLRELHASVLAHNAGMLAVFRQSGLPMVARVEEGVVNVRLSL